MTPMAMGFPTQSKSRDGPADGWVAGVVEGNRVVNTLFGEYHDTESSSDLTVRNNYFQGVHFGIYQNLGAAGSLPCDPIHPPTRDPATLIATITAPIGHGLSVGQGVRLSTVPPTAYDGFFDVLAIPSSPHDANGSPTTFTVQLLADPGGTSPTNPRYGELYQVSRLVTESNQIELNASADAGHPSSGLICIGRDVAGSPWSLHQVFMRENLVRSVSAVADTFGLATLNGAVMIQRAENNLVTLGNANPMGFNISGIATFLNNQTPSGTLQRGYKRLPSPSNGTQIDELATSIADALAFSLF